MNDMSSTIILTDIYSWYVKHVEKYSRYFRFIHKKRTGTRQIGLRMHRGPQSLLSVSRLYTSVVRCLDEKTRSRY